MYRTLQSKMDIDKVLAVEVDHCEEAYACLLAAKRDFGPGGKILYSGDTLPATNLINYAQGSSLLIHEATLEKGMEK